MTSLITVSCGILGKRGLQSYFTILMRKLVVLPDSGSVRPQGVCQTCAKSTSERPLVLLFFFHFLIEFFELLSDFRGVFGVRVQVEVALIGLDGLLLQSLFFLRFA
jgi:hypothetical protein